MNLFNQYIEFLFMYIKIITHSTVFRKKQLLYKFIWRASQYTGEINS